MRDEKTPGIDFNGPRLVTGRFVGAGTSVPTKISGCAKNLTLARTGVGAYTLTFTDPPVGTPENFAAWVCSGTNDKNVRTTPLAVPFVSPYQVTLQVTYHANGSAVDLTSSEELHMESWLSVAGTP